MDCLGTEKGPDKNLRCWNLERVFPKLQAAGYVKTSERTGYPPNPGAYNCIAWAAHDVNRFWWPHEDAYWPSWSKRENAIENFVTAFRWLGYRVCENSNLEFGFEKVALYAIGEEPQHMARQLSDGSWTSKCGGDEDIKHFTLDALESYGPAPNRANYGSPVLYMKRLKVLGWLVRIAQTMTAKFD
jgi:hypothetical protein